MDDDFEQVVDVLREYIPMTEQVLMEVAMLVKAGCNVADAEFALDAWSRARRIDEHWGYVRTVMLVHRAEKNVMFNALVKEQASHHAENH